MIAAYDVREGDLWELPASRHDTDPSPRTYLIVAILGPTVRRFWYIGNGPAVLGETCADVITKYGRLVCRGAS